MSPAALPAVAAASPMPVSARVGVVLVLLAVAVGCAVTVVLSRAGRLRRAGRIGVRTPAALASEAAFGVANRTAAPYLAVAAAVAALSAVLVAVTGLRGSGGIAALVGCGVVVGGLLVVAASRAERAARGVAPAPDRPGRQRRARPTPRRR